MSINIFMQKSMEISLEVIKYETVKNKLIGCLLQSYNPQHLVYPIFLSILLVNNKTTATVTCL